MNDQTHTTTAASGEPIPTVFARDGEAFASSRDVADHFGKEVKHVHEAIKNLIAKEREWGAANFRPNYINDLSGQSVGNYDMTRDGLSILAMGFTGVKALKWKVRYIEAFNAMEAELRARPMPTLPDFTDPKVLLGAFQHLQEQVAAKDAVIADQKKDLVKLERLEGADGSMCITDAAKTLNVRPKDLFARMSAERWIYKRSGSEGWRAYQDKIQAGYMEHDDHLYLNSLNEERVKTRALVTAKGLVKLAEILSRPLH